MMLILNTLIRTTATPGVSSNAKITTLTFTPDNPCNTTITSATGEALYSVDTKITNNTTCTQVRNASNEVIGSLEWREVLPDKVTVKNRSPVSFGDWMKKSMIPFKEQVSFTDERERKYKWKGIGPGRSLELYSDYDSFSEPVARYHRSRNRLDSSSSSRGPERPSSEPMASQYSLSHTLTDAESIAPTLTDAQSITSTLIDGRSVTSTTRPRVVDTSGELALLPHALEIRDLVVVSLLFLEKQHWFTKAE